LIDCESRMTGRYQWQHPRKATVSHHPWKATKGCILGKHCMLIVDFIERPMTTVSGHPVAFLFG
jgi:hypothetical protein